MGSCTRCPATPPLLWFFGLLFFVSIVSSSSLRTTLSTACGNLEVPSGTTVTGGDWEYGGALLLRFPNGTHTMVESCRTQEEITQLKSIPVEDPHITAKAARNGPPNQWLAWYNANYPVWNNGGTQLSSYWRVPSLPSRLTANLAIFPGLQPTYNPTNYDFILQPVLSLGTWMDGGSHKTWGYNAVTCVSSAGYCIYAKMFNVNPGDLLYGTMNLVNSTNGQYCWLVNATSMTSGEGNTIRYCTKYMITFAFATLEHAPVGSIGSCNSLPPGQITFTDTTAVPDFIGGWQGVLGSDASCGIAVDTFPYGNLTITF